MISPTSIRPGYECCTSFTLAHLGGVGVPNGTPLYGVTPPPKGSTVFLSDSSHFTTKQKIANTAIRRKSSGGVLALVEVAKSFGEAIAIQVKEMSSVTKKKWNLIK